MVCLSFLISFPFASPHRTVYYILFSFILYCLLADRGYCPDAKMWGRKRHVLVDTEGNLMHVKVTGADDSDLAGGKQLLEPLHGRFPRLQLIWGDSH
jgi:hypothetical protein